VKTHDPSRGHLLVATDFSDNAAAAYAHAAGLAQRLGTPLRLLHVSDARTRIQECEPADWLAAVGLTDADLARRDGVPWLEILQYAEHLPASVVVVGTRGQSDSALQVPGTTTLCLLRYSRIPVLVVPAPGDA
jgi:nucleotide-binding universal stress UspA family protein